MSAAAFGSEFGKLTKNLLYYVRIERIDKQGIQVHSIFDKTSFTLPVNGSIEIKRRLSDVDGR